MPDNKPRNILDPDNMSLMVLGPILATPNSPLAQLLTGDFPTHRVDDLENPPWHDASLWKAIENTKSEQLVIVSQQLGSYETALVMITLQKGFATYFVSPAIADDPEHRIARLRQASAIVMTPEDALAELRLSTTGQRF